MAGKGTAAETARQRHLRSRVPDAMAGERLDRVLASLFPEYSRSRLQQWVKAGRVTLDARTARNRDKVRGGETVEVDALFEAQVAVHPQPIELAVVYEDADLLVIDKPAGLVVHPAAGNPDGTLQNALLYRDPSLAELPRAGIVHRLDKDTTGLLVVARTPAAHRRLVEALEARRIHREYRAVVQGALVAGGQVDAPVGRHPVHRTRMAVTPNGKAAVTDYRVLERFPAHTYLQLKLHSGRTHQIRVHMAHIRHPLVGDPQYGGRLRLPKGAGASLRDILSRFRRQALHACRLGLEHPRSGEPMEWTAPLPADLEELLGALREDAAAR
ncbi:MAG: 23S rRNA pseudouridine(1911/1915/1917) synthase RluD [Pseudomonadota bacterium]